MLKKILFILDNKQKKKVIIFFLFSILIIFLELLSLGMLIPLVNIITNPSDFIDYLTFVPFDFSILKTANVIILVLVLFNALILIKSIFLYIAQKYQIKFMGEFQENLQNKLFRNYIYQSITSLMKKNISQINRNAVDLPNEFTTLLLTPILTIISDVALLIFIVMLLIFTEPVITITGATVMLGVGAYIFFINKRILIFNGKKYTLNKSEIIKTVNETFGAILEVKSFKKENLFINKFQVFSKDLKDIRIKLSILNFVPKILFEIISIILISIFFIILSLRFDNLNEMLSLLVLFSFAIIKITPLINKILANAQRIKYSQPFLNEIYATLSILNLKKTDLTKTLKFKNSIDLLNIDYQYSKSRFILKNINLSIKKNQFIGISGESGSGKSTLLKIILGLIEPIGGKILLDGKEILSNLTQWQEKISFVPQDVFILDDTLRNNITLEVEENRVDFKKLELVINLSNLRTFFDRLPKGYETILGDKGSRISGGQKQRIGIARALYSISEIIVFDESTSSIDEKNEIEIFKNLQKLKEHKTIIFVTHRKTIKEYCDNFYFLEDDILKKYN
jgi:ABC-type bacteriocin/lantibiotic exporter with double-glycine peptidase domain